MELLTASPPRDTLGLENTPVAKVPRPPGVVQLIIPLSSVET